MKDDDIKEYTGLYKRRIFTLYHIVLTLRTIVRNSRTTVTIPCRKELYSEIIRIHCDIV